MRKFINIICLAFLIIWILPKFFMVSIPAWEIGVRRSLISGIHEEDLGLGYHMRLPFVHSYYQLPRTLQFLDYSNEDPDAELKSLEIRTSGNNIIYVDVTIPWRIKDGEAWQIIREGFGDSYADKVASTCTGILRETLAAMSTTDIYQTDKRTKTAASILPKLNQALGQYHVMADHVIIRNIGFRPEYEQKLQDKQFFVVQGRLDEAKRKESEAIQQTDTFEKAIQKDINVKREEWNGLIEDLKTKYELEIAAIKAEALQYDASRRAEADAVFATSQAEGDLAEAQAEALGNKLKAQALSTQAGRTYSAIIAAENFELGDIQLNSNDAQFLQNFASMKAWRNFFMGQ